MLVFESTINCLLLISELVVGVDVESVDDDWSCGVVNPAVILSDCWCWLLLLMLLLLLLLLLIIVAVFSHEAVAKFVEDSPTNVAAIGLEGDSVSATDQFLSAAAAIKV